MKKEEVTNKIKDFIEKAIESVDDIIITSDEPIFKKDNEKDDIETIWFKVRVGNPYYYFNRNGEAVFALNHIAKKILDKHKKESDLEEGEDFNILVDVNDFQKKRIDNIKNTVHMMAERARYFKSDMEIDPMSAFERRIVHEFLADAVDLETESRGQGRGRFVVIKYIGKDKDSIL